ncbi:MAG: hypothetical protein MRK01_17515 [Candidatus Scalindua sp.]|nr:hypothetical protein [Candidatus Scalindua sp.]
MQFVIDSNVYIFAFGPSNEYKAFDFLSNLLDNTHLHSIRIPRTIFEEVKRNISPETFPEFSTFIHELTSVDEDIIVPFEIAFKYETIGFKPADAFIAAYTEWVGADALVTENRHFMTLHSGLPLFFYIFLTLIS